MSESKKFTFAERVRLNDEMASLVEVPYILWRTTADVAEPQLPNLTVEGRLQEQEANLLNRFSDSTLSDLAYETVSEELLQILQERPMIRPGTTNIAKGDFVQLRSGDIVKVREIVKGIVRAKRKDGSSRKIRVTRLVRIGKHQGRPAFGFLSPKQD